MLSIRLFGPPHITLDDEPLALTRRKSRALLFYLAAQPAPVGRELLIDLFWPDLDRPSAQQTLRTTLHGLRKALGPALLADEALALAPGADVDARRFELALAAPTRDPQELAAALDLYRGEFLQGFSLPDAPAFEEWSDAQRARFQQLSARGLADLAELYERRRDYRAALDTLGRALASDPLQEELQRAAMRLHYRAGDRVGAIRRYEQFRDLLDDELGVPPMPETRALYDAIVTERLEADEQPAADDRRPLTKDEGRRTKDEGPAANDHRLQSADEGRRTKGEGPTAEEAGQRADGPRPATVGQAFAHDAQLRPAWADELPFAGRADELRALRALAGSGRLALIVGEPGIGKTRLAEEFLRSADVLPLTGAARELEHSLPYQPIIEALRALLAHPAWPELRAGLQVPPVWLAETARLLPELAPDAPPPAAPADESRLWEGVSQFLSALARRRPLALLLDDAQWADAATLGLLGYLVRRAPAGATFLATSRPVAPRTPLALLLQSLTREGRLERIELARLSTGEVAALARHLSPDAALADWLAQAAEGNPYITAELVRDARAHGLLRPDRTLDHGALARAPRVPPSVYSLIQSRLDRLSDQARRVMDAAVAVGREFEFPLVAQAAGISEAEALDALDELRAAGVVQPADGLHFRFDHSLTMEVAYREVGEPRHRLMHRRVAEALEQRYAGHLDRVAGLLASHYAEGEAPGQAARFALMAGEQAAALAAWHEAVGFFEQALTGAEGPQRRQTMLALGNAHLQSGAAGRAGELFGAALAEAEREGDEEGAGQARLALATSLLPQARYAETVALARRVHATGSPELVIQAEFLCGTALSIEGADLEGATRHLRAAELLIQQQYLADPTDALARVRFELGSVAAQQGRLREAVGLYREALITARQLRCDQAVHWQVLAHNNLAYHLLLLDDPEAQEHLRAGMRLAQEHGLLGLLPYLHSTAGELALARGDLDAAERAFAEGLELAERLDIPERLAGLTANLGLLAKRRGESALAVQRLSDALARADALGLGHLAAQIRIWLAPLLPPAEARAILQEARALAERGSRARLLEQIEAVGARAVRP
jgi:DNA-binding SARP family transcriptional activator